jgi:uncharacterized protein YbjT (DUF2867 family)
MNVLIFGATGMVGQGVLRECLLDADVRLVSTLGRTPTGLQNAKLREIVHRDLFHYESIEAQLYDFDACFFCLGVSSTGMNEADYTRITHDIALAASQTLSRLNPQMTLVFVSGAGSDRTEQGRIMWARVKGKTENTLLRQPFKAVYIFRPSIIQPLQGIQSKTSSYRIFYTLSKPVLPLMRRLFPNTVLTTEQIGRAMLAVVKRGAPKPILEAPDIRVLSLSLP